MQSSYNLHGAKYATHVSPFEMPGCSGRNHQFFVGMIQIIWEYWKRSVLICICSGSRESAIRSKNQVTRIELTIFVMVFSNLHTFMFYVDSVQRSLKWILPALFGKVHHFTIQNSLDVSVNSLILFSVLLISWRSPWYTVHHSSTHRNSDFPDLYPIPTPQVLSNLCH